MQDLAAMVQIGLSAGLLLFGVAYMHHRTRNDWYREDLFTMRDELFDYMWRNGVSFDLPAYRLLRDFFNGAIRCADVSGITFVSLLLLWRNDRRAPALTMALVDALESIEDESLKGHLDSLHRRAVERAQRHLLSGLSGIVFRTVVVPLYRSDSGALPPHTSLMAQAGADGPYAIALAGRGR